MDPRAGLEYVKKRKLLTLPGLELRPLDHRARNQSLYTDCAIPPSIISLLLYFSFIFATLFNVLMAVCVFFFTALLIPNLYFGHRHHQLHLHVAVSRCIVVSYCRVRHYLYVVKHAVNTFTWQLLKYKKRLLVNF